jgi:tRNA(fMet)-specific endonuclease VapC
MSLLFDTNILVHFTGNFGAHQTRKIVNVNNQEVFVSVASIAELKSLALRNNWGGRRLKAIDEILVEMTVIEITENLLNTYAEIDVYSQRRNPRMGDYPFATPRNMGKNDLWIAATASLLGLKLVTTDADFNHLHEVFIEVQVLKPELFKAN